MHLVGQSSNAPWRRDCTHYSGESEHGASHVIQDAINQYINNYGPFHYWSVQSRGLFQTPWGPLHTFTYIAPKSNSPCAIQTDKRKGYIVDPWAQSFVFGDIAGEFDYQTHADPFYIPF